MFVEYVSLFVRLFLTSIEPTLLQTIKKLLFKITNAILFSWKEEVQGVGSKMEWE